MCDFLQMASQFACSQILEVEFENTQLKLSFLPVVFLCVCVVNLLSIPCVYAVDKVS